MRINCYKCGHELNLMFNSFCCGRVHLYEYPDRGKVVAETKLTEEQEIKIAEKKNRRRNKRPRPEVIAAVKNRDKNKCVKCGGTKNLQVHHKHHRKNGGTHDMENLETLCDLCHAEEHRDENVYGLMLKRAFGIA